MCRKLMLLNLILFMTQYGKGADTLRISKISNPHRNFVLTQNNYLSIRLKTGQIMQCKIIEIDSAGLIIQKNNPKVKGIAKLKINNHLFRRPVIQQYKNSTGFWDTVLYPIKDTVRLSEINYIIPDDQNVVGFYNKYYAPIGYSIFGSYISMQFFFISGFLAPAGYLITAGTTAVLILINHQLDRKKFRYKKWNFAYQ